MDAFEYLSVLLSIVLGLGITQLLAGFGRWLEHRAVLRPYVPTIAWAAFLLVAHVQSWWAMFGLRHYEDWNFLQFSIVLLQPTLLFLLVQLTFPSAHAAELDLRRNFFTQQRWFFGLFVALLLVSLVKDVVRNGALPDALNLGFHGLWLLVAAIAMFTRHDGVQRVLAWIALASIGSYVALLFAELA